MHPRAMSECASFCLSVCLSALSLCSELDLLLLGDEEWEQRDVKGSSVAHPVDSKGKTEKQEEGEEKEVVKRKIIRLDTPSSESVERAATSHLTGVVCRVRTCAFLITSEDTISTSWKELPHSSTQTCPSPPILIPYTDA